MDLKNVDSTSVWAIRAMFTKIWSMVPTDFRLTDKSTYNSQSIQPFYDPELTFENRAQYKMAKIEAPERAEPWIIVTWNTEQGVEPAEAINRRFSTYKEVDNAQVNSYKYREGSMTINFSCYSNSIGAILEFQENCYLKIRDKQVFEVVGHTVIDPMNVTLESLEMTLHKLPRDKATLSYLFIRAKVSYPIIGNEQEAYRIERIDLRTHGSNDDELTHDIVLPE
jgi:hypothetical protein